MSHKPASKHTYNTLPRHQLSILLAIVGLGCLAIYPTSIIALCTLSASIVAAINE